jgi:hypothetical protein
MNFVAYAFLLRRLRGVLGGLADGTDYASQVSFQ